jgi:hypothetical protein
MWKFHTQSLAAPALRQVGLGYLAGGDSPGGSTWNGCGWAAETIDGVVNHALHRQADPHGLFAIR